MARLKNPKHEKFSQLIALGWPKYKAYQQVFNTKKPCQQRSNASRLWKLNGKTSENIQRRTYQIMEAKMKAKDLSRDDILDRVLAEAELASESGQHSASLKAYEMLGKESFRMFTERKENVNINVNTMSKEQLNTFILERYGERSQQLLQWIESNIGNTVNPAVDAPERVRPASKPMLTVIDGKLDKE